MISNKNLLIASGFAIISTYFIFSFWNKSFSSLNVNVEMNRHAAINEAVDKSKSISLIQNNSRNAAIYNFDSELRDYIELKQGGREEFQDIIDQNIYSPFYWSVRIFEENKIPEGTFWFKPNGDPYGFNLKIPEDHEDSSLSEEEALKLATNSINEYWVGDFADYDLLESSFIKQSNNRIDHSFIFEHSKKDIGKARIRLKIEIVGTQLSKVEQFTFIPEEFSREFTNMRSSNDAIAIVSQLFMFGLYMLGIGIPAMIYLYRKGWLEYKVSLIAAGVIATTSTLVSLNSFPLLFFFYDTATSMTQFMIQQLLGLIATGLLNFFLFAISFVLAESLTRKAFPGHIQLWKTWNKDIASSRYVLNNTIMSYLIVPCFLAFVILFYYISQKYLGFWSPSEALIDPNYLAAIFPWYTGLAISLQAGFWEEMLFRALPLAAGLLIGRYYKRPTTGIVLAMVIQTLIFGAGHANYPSTPSYARVVELIIPSLMFGFVYLRMGVVFGAITHYIYDVVLFSLPIFFSTGYIIDKAMVVIGVLIPLGVVIIQRYRSKKWNELSHEVFNENYKPQLISKKKVADKEEFIGHTKNINKTFLGSGALICFIILFVFQNSRVDIEMDSVQLDRKDAIDIAKDYLNTNNIDLDENYEAYATLINGYSSQDFVWQELGEQNFKELLGSYILAPRWTVRFVNFEGDLESRNEEVNLSIGLNGKVKRFDHKIPEERPGLSLSKKDAKVLADNEVFKRFNLEAPELIIISEQNEQRPERVDWKFIYEEKNNLDYEGIQLRTEVEISGDKINQYTQYVFVPEEWERMNRDRSGMPGILNTILSAGSGLLLVFIFLFNGFRILFKNMLSYKTALIFTLFALLGFVNLFNDSSLVANLPTDQPIGNLKLIAYITVGFVLIVTSLFSGLAFATIKSMITKSVNKIPLIDSILGGLFSISLLYTIKIFLDSSFHDLYPTYPEISLAGLFIPFIKTVNIYPGILSSLVFNLLAAKILFDLTKGYKNSIRNNIIGVILTMLLIGFGKFSLTFYLGTSLIKVFIFSIAVFLIYKYVIKNNFTMLPFFTLGGYYINNVLDRGSFFGFQSYPNEGFISLLSVIIAAGLITYLMKFVFEED